MLRSRSRVILAPGFAGTTGASAGLSAVSESGVYRQQTDSLMRMTVHFAAMAWEHMVESCFHLGCCKPAVDLIDLKDSWPTVLRDRFEKVRMERVRIGRTDLAHRY